MNLSLKESCHYINKILFPWAWTTPLTEGTSLGEVVGKTDETADGTMATREYIRYAQEHRRFFYSSCSEKSLLGKTNILLHRFVQENQPRAQPSQLAPVLWLQRYKRKLNKHKRWSSNSSQCLNELQSSIHEAGGWPCGQWVSFYQILSQDTLNNSWVLQIIWGQWGVSIPSIQPVIMISMQQRQR